MCARRGLLLRKVTGEYVNILSVLMHCVTGRIFLRDKHEKKASKIEILASAKRNARLFDHLSHIFPPEKGHRLRSGMHDTDNWALPDSRSRSIDLSDIC